MRMAAGDQSCQYPLPKVKIFPKRAEICSQFTKIHPEFIGPS
jgi:hypothetical protein